jgi:hypothetical protein
MACELYGNIEGLKAHVSLEIKLQAKAVADRGFLSEAAWLKRLVLRETPFLGTRKHWLADLPTPRG